MATNLSQLGLEVDKVEHQDIATGGTDKVILYASGSGSDTKLYVKSGGDTQKQLGFDIDQLSALGGTGIAQGDHFAFSDAGTEKKITFSNLEDAIFGNVSGDATIAAGGALTIAAQAVENSMLADDAVGADELAANAVVNASVVDGALKADKLDIDGSTDIGADLADADLMIVDDGAGGTNRKSALSRVKKYIYSAMSGDATASDTGALTIAANAVEGSMLNTNAISGQTEMTGDLADTDELMVSDGGTLKRADFSVVRDAVFADVSGDATVAAGGALTIAANAVEGSMLNSNAAGDGLGYASNALKVQVSGAVEIGSDKLGIVAAFAGDGLVASGSATHIGGLSVNVDDSSIEINSDALRVKAQGITNAMLADDAVGADELAANAVVNASIASNAAIDMDKLDGGSLASSLSDLAQGDLLYAGDVDDSNNLKSITFSNLEDAIFGNVSGDATVAAGGALTIAADAVEGSMLNDNVISGQTELAHADIVDADELMISDGGVLKKVGVDSLRDHFFGVISGDATVADGGAVTLAAAQTNVTSLLATDIKIGEDDQTKIDFETEDEIHFYAANAEQVFVADGVFGPQTDSDVDLGADGTAFKKLFVDDIDLNGQGRIDLDADGDTSIRSAADDQIQLEVGGADMVTVLSTGVGINGGYGNGSGTGISLGADGTVNADSNLNLGANGAGASLIVYGAAASERMMYDKDNHVLQFRDGNGTMLTLGGDATTEFALDVADGSNNINKVRAAAFVTYSDESLKQDVTSMANTALDTIMSLEGVEFTWKNSGERDFGFIAQDVQSVLPKAVHTASDGVQGVDYSRLTSVLVEAVKAQQVQIEELKALLKK